MGAVRGNGNLAQRESGREMEKRNHLYVDRRHPAVWLTGLLLLTSAIVRIVVFSGINGVGVWRQIVWPVFAAVLFALITILAGKDMLYKTAIPVWIMGVCTAWQLCVMAEGKVLICIAACVCMLLFCTAYTLSISGRFHRGWMLLLDLLVLAAAGHAHHRVSLLDTEFASVWYVLPTYLMILAMMALLGAIKVHNDEAYHPTWGDRSDGRLIRSTPAIDRIGPYIMVNRNSANNLFSESVEITELEKYVRRKRQEGLSGFGMSHVIIAAYVRTVAKYPALNRFVAGQKVYSRGEDIVVSMTVKKELSLSSPDTVIKVHLNPRDTAEDVYRKFNAQVEEAKNTPLDSNVDNTAGLLTVIPGIVLKFVVWLLKTLDYFGLIPGFLLEISPFHGSAYFTSMASLGIRPVYHHLYDFGTIPVFCAFGKKRRATEIVDGEMVTKKYVDMKFNLDERICDGYYYAALLKHFIRILKKPDVLDQPPAVVEKDIP